MNTSLWQEQIKVKVYVRNYKKNAILMTIDAPIASRQLRDKIEKQFKQQIPECALFYKGRRVEDNETLIALEPFTIIHIVDVKRTVLPELKLVFRVRNNVHQPNHPDNLSLKIKVKSDAFIRDVLQNEIKGAIGKGETDVFLVYLGKPLNIFKKFQDELVEDHSEILVVQFKREEVLDHTRVERVPSIRKTDVNYAPVLEHRSLEESQKNQESFTIKSSSQQFSIAPTQKIKGSSVFSKNKPKLGTLNPSASVGLEPITAIDPNIQAAPGQKVRVPGEKVKYDKNLEQISTAPPQNPEKGVHLLNADDLLFAGDPQLEETENVLGGAVQEMKENFIKKKKKKSQSSSEHSKE